MSASIPPKVTTALWLRAGGRCEYEGCNKVLWRDDVTLAKMNRSYIAHIIASSPGGPRGDQTLSPQLAKELSNLMLLCDEHHRLIDREGLADHSVERLTAMKRAHEARIELVTSIAPNKKSHVLLYGANIGTHSSPLSWNKTAQALLPHRYPAEEPGIELGLRNSSFDDSEEEFWSIEREHLQRQFAKLVAPRLAENEVEHFSIFGLAPQPLLIELGRLLSDIPAADVYQLHREPPDWLWQEDPDRFDFIIDTPKTKRAVVGLNLSLSATIDNSRIAKVLGEDASIWRMTIPDPNNDFLKGRGQLRLFREEFRRLLDRVKDVHGEEATLHVFPAVPVAVAVEIGRVWMPKADLRIEIYDQNTKNNGFSHAFGFGQKAGRNQP